MLKKIKTLTAAAGAALLAAPAAAAYNLTAWNPEGGEYTRYWFDWSAGTFAPYGFLNSVTLPFVDIVGYFFFVLLWAVYLFGVWNRAMSIELVVVALLIFAPLWGIFLPAESYPVGIICLAIGITAIVYKLYKRA